MTAAGIVAFGACSAAGEGVAAFRGAPLGEPAAVFVRRDEELAAAGLGRPWAARAQVAALSAAQTDRDRATVLLEHALAECAASLDRVLPDWRSLRVGAAIGTSSGGMRSFEGDVSLAPDRPHQRLYLGPVIDAARPCAFEPFSLVLGACASSTLALGLGRAWLLEDRCDLVLAGGFDAVSVFVAAGFEALRATSARGGVHPFRPGRDGLALGEGAGIVALARPPEARRAGALGWIAGFGASCDAMNITAPDPEGRGLGRAARLALDQASLPVEAVGLVSAHGTATLQNDAAEAAAIASLASAAPVVASKGTLGHTLGAAGVLETLAAVDAMRRGIVPASAGDEAPERGIGIAARTSAGTARSALKLSSAFGGVNAALVVTLDEPASRSLRPNGEVFVSRAAKAGLADADPKTLAARTGAPADRLARGDALVRLAIAACAALAREVGSAALHGAGIVVGHGLATIETNAAFLARIRAEGAARASPRPFPYTSPNAVAGECAIVFRLTGPAFAVGGGPHGGVEALAVAADLVRSGAAERMVVVAADDGGPASAAVARGTAPGAVALLVGRSATDTRAATRLEEATVRLDPSGSVPSPLPPMTCHLTLAEFDERARSRESGDIRMAGPWGVRAWARFGGM